MASRTQLFQMLPWTGGLNTSVDESLIPANQLTVADNLIFDTRGSRRKREGIDHDYDNLTASETSVIGLHDFWYGATTRSQRLISVRSDRKVYNLNAGTATLLTDAGTAWSGTLTTASLLTFNNLCIIAVSGSGNVIKKYSGSGDIADLDGTPPQASILREHLGRIWCNDKTRPDRLHYSETHDHTQWNGLGDSGAIDIGVGDGDPEGITAIFPTFKGELFVAKRTKLYRVSGYTPETFQVSLVSSGVGCVSHNSVAQIDQDDIMWVSEKGVHSLSATASFGDFTSSHVSIDIQRTFNDDFERARLKYVWGAYLPNINSVAFAFTETSSANRSLTNNSVNNALYLYNIPLKAWYRWNDLPCQSLVVANDSDQKRLYFGSHTGRVSKSFSGSNYDTSAAGANTAIRMRVVTGQVFPDQNPYGIKALKRFILYYRPRGNHTVNVTVQIDNFGMNSENQLVFSEASGTALLGSTFILGSSVLAYEVVLGPYARTIDGIGRGVKISIEQSQTDSEVEIQGFALEFEPSGTASEIFLRG